MKTMKMKLMNIYLKNKKYNIILYYIIMSNVVLPIIIAASIVGGVLFFRGGYVAYSNINDPEQSYQVGSKYMDNSIFTGFFGKTGGGKTKHKKYRKGKNTRKKFEINILKEKY